MHTYHSACSSALLQLLQTALLLPERHVARVELAIPANPLVLVDLVVQLTVLVEVMERIRVVEQQKLRDLQKAVVHGQADGRPAILRYATLHSDGHENPSVVKQHANKLEVPALDGGEQGMTLEVARLRHFFSCDEDNLLREEEHFRSVVLVFHRRIRQADQQLDEGEESVAVGVLLGQGRIDVLRSAPDELLHDPPLPRRGRELKGRTGPSLGNTELLGERALPFEDWYLVHPEEVRVLPEEDRIDPRLEIRDAQVRTGGEEILRVFGALELGEFPHLLGSIGGYLGQLALLREVALQKQLGQFVVSLLQGRKKRRARLVPQACPSRQPRQLLRSELCAGVSDVQGHEGDPQDQANRLCLGVYLVLLLLTPDGGGRWPGGAEVDDAPWQSTVHRMVPGMLGILAPVVARHLGHDQRQPFPKHGRGLDFPDRGDVGGRRLVQVQVALVRLLAHLPHRHLESRQRSRQPLRAGDIHVVGDGNGMILGARQPEELVLIRMPPFVLHLPTILDKALPRQRIFEAGPISVLGVSIRQSLAPKVRPPLLAPIMVFPIGISVSSPPADRLGEGRGELRDRAMDSAAPCVFQILGLGVDQQGLPIGSVPGHVALLPLVQASAAVLAQHGVRKPQTLFRRVQGRGGADQVVQRIGGVLVPDGDPILYAGVLQIALVHIPLLDEKLGELDELVPHGVCQGLLHESAVLLPRGDEQRRPEEEVLRKHVLQRQRGRHLGRHADRVVGHCEGLQALVLGKRLAQSGRPLVLDPVVVGDQFTQRLVVEQRVGNVLRAVGANLVGRYVQPEQRRVLAQSVRYALRTARADPVPADVQRRERRLYQDEARHGACSLLLELVPGQVEETQLRRVHQCIAEHPSGRGLQDAAADVEGRQLRVL
eukprot:scaffold2331_cov252-Pinguiococcus_pyrenoidosus.AAC.3